MIKFFFYLHLLGIVVLLTGVMAYFYLESGSQTVGAMVGVSSAIGLGLLMISPYPVVKAMQWMMNESLSVNNEEENNL